MAKKNTYPTPLDQAYATLRKKLDVIGDNFKVSPSDAEDLIQEGYLRLVENDIKIEKEAEGWLWITMRNLSVDWFRKFKKLSSISDHDFEDFRQEDSHHLDCDLLCVQMKSLLSPLQFKIMTLLVVDELDYPEIAKKLKMTEGAVRTNVSRARKILKQKMKL